MLFRLFAQLYAMYDYKLTAEAGADAGEAHEILLECGIHGPDIIYYTWTHQTLYLVVIW